MRKCREVLRQKSARSSIGPCVKLFFHLCRIRIPNPHPETGRAMMITSATRRRRNGEEGAGTTGDRLDAEKAEGYFLF